MMKNKHTQDKRGGENKPYILDGNWKDSGLLLYNLESWLSFTNNCNFIDAEPLRTGYLEG